MIVPQYRTEGNSISCHCGDKVFGFGVSFFNRPKIKPILQCISQKHLWMCDIKEGTLHDSHMLVYADAAFPVLHLLVVWRCSCRSSRKARLSQHRLESPQASPSDNHSAHSRPCGNLSCFSEVDCKGGELMQCRGCGRRLAWEGRREDARRTNTWPGENCETHEKLVGAKPSWAGSRDFASFLLCWPKLSIWKSLHQNWVVIEGDCLQVNISSWWFMDCLLFSDQRLKTFHRIFCWSDKVSFFYSQVVLLICGYTKAASILSLLVIITSG